MDPYPPPIFVIPGMRVGCMPYDTMIKSNLECFFNQTCVNITANLISTLAPVDWPTALNRSESKHSPTSTITLISEQQMIEDWRKSVNFTPYFNSCAPYECSYTLLERNNYAYLISLLLSLFGGLTVAIRFIAPPLVSVSHMIHNTFARKRQSQGHSIVIKTGIVKFYSIYL